MSCYNCHLSTSTYFNGNNCVCHTKKNRQDIINTEASNQKCSNFYQPDSLLNVTSKIVAENEPFQSIEEKYDRIPEPVQRRIIYWSFPRNERDICMYSSLSRVSSHNSSDTQNLSFCKGLKLLESGCVENVLQVGFHLSGIVWSYPQNSRSPQSNTSLSSNNNNANNNQLQPNQIQNIRPNDRDGNGSGSSNTVANLEDNKKFKVSVSFDRCKITSVTCSCDTKDIFWCHHVVALSLYRIRNADTIKLRVPISETLLQMNRQQLQKFIQYLISEHHTEVLPTAQKLADEILQQRSEINAICGAPDPTAGAATDDDHSWHLDELQVCEAVRSYLGQGNYYNGNKQLNSLFAKVREMLRAQDSNGARMLTLITEQFLNDPRLLLWKNHRTPMTEKCRQLWDQLGALWVCIVLNPRATSSERFNWKLLLEKWSKNEACPQEDPDFRAPGSEHYRERSHRERERERNRFFRENNLRNMMYNQNNNGNNNANQPVPNHQQPQPPNNNNYNDDNFDSSESDSDSESDMEEILMQDNPEHRNVENNRPVDDNNLMMEEAEDNDDHNPNDPNGDNNEIEEESNEEREAHGMIEEELNYIDHRRNDLLDRQNVPCFDENSRSNFNISMLDERANCAINVDIMPPENDDSSSRESMEVDDDNEVELGNININLDIRNDNDRPSVRGEIDHQQPGPSGLGRDYFKRHRSPASSTNDDDKLCTCNEKYSDNDSGCEKCQRRRKENDLDFNNVGVLGACDSNYCSNSCQNHHHRLVVPKEDDVAGAAGEENRHVNICDSTKSCYSKQEISTDELKLCLNETAGSSNKIDDSTDSDDQMNENVLCTCVIDQLDHINGHSSKMSLDLPKLGNKKCNCSNSKKNEIDIREEVRIDGNDDAVERIEINQNEEPNEPNLLNNDENSVEQERMNVEQIVEDPECIGRGIIRPREDENNARPVKKSKLNNGNSNRNKAPRTIFHKALDAVNMTWDNQHLKNILAGDSYSISSSNSVQIAGSSKMAVSNTISLRSNFNVIGQPLWHEPLSMCAARIDSLRSHGHTDAALRLSVGVVRTMKQIQRDGQSLWHQYQTTMINIKRVEERSSEKEENQCCCSCSRKCGETSNQKAIDQSTPSTSAASMSANNCGGSSDKTENAPSSSAKHSSSYTMVRFDYLKSSKSQPHHSNSPCDRCFGIGWDRFGSNNPDGGGTVPHNSTDRHHYSNNMHHHNRYCNYDNVPGHHNYPSNRRNPSLMNVPGNGGIPSNFKRSIPYHFGNDRMLIYDSYFGNNQMQPPFPNNHYVPPRFNNHYSTFNLNPQPPHHQSYHCESHNCDFYKNKPAPQPHHHHNHHHHGPPPHAPPSASTSSSMYFYNCNKRSSYHYDGGRPHGCHERDFHPPMNQGQITGPKLPDLKLVKPCSCGKEGGGCGNSTGRDEPSSGSLDRERMDHDNSQPRPSTSGTSSNSGPLKPPVDEKLIAKPQPPQASNPQQPPPPPYCQSMCKEHKKGQCCIKNFCCKMVAPLPKMDVQVPSTSAPSSSSSTSSLSCKKCLPPLIPSLCQCLTTKHSNDNTFNHHQYSQAACYNHHDTNYYNHRMPPPYLGSSSTAASSSMSECKSFSSMCPTGDLMKRQCCNEINPFSETKEKPNLNSIVNYGASTSKSTAVPVAVTSSSNSSSSTLVKPPEFVRNKKPNCVSDCLDCSVGCEVDFPLDAVSCIFDCLTEACIIPDAINGPDMGRLTFDSVTGAAEDGSIIPPRYQHVPVPGSNDPNETYLTLAFEAAILALGKQRIMPQGLYSQHVVCKQQDQLINRLRHVDLDRLLVEVLKNLTLHMLDDGPTSGFGVSIHPESVPMHTLARFLFASLLNQYPDLAFQAGLRAMRLPVLEDVSESAGENSVEIDQHYQRDGFVLTRYPRWWTLGHLETQQCQLSSTMLSAAKGDPVRLAAVLQSARRNIHSSSHLFKLAQDAFRFATPENGPRSQTLLGVAFELGLQVMRMTLTCLNYRRREMVRWLVTCATHLGLDALKSIMQNWMHLFTPTEATGPVATNIMSHATILRLNLSFVQQEELSSYAKTLALQCANKDPPNCALNALTLCENDSNAFETAYQIVIDAATSIMSSSQLFTIARYMEHRGYPMRAYKLAILAMKNVHLAYNQDTHPAINDIYWACALSHSLGKCELGNIIPIVIKNVQCATVLSDILRRCSVPTPGISPFNSHHRGSNMRPCQKLSYDRAPLRQLLEAAVTAYVNTTHSRLSHISPRHYGDFIDFLSKARDTFILARDGPTHFSRLIENITVAYKGKKKLVRQVRQRFHFV